MKEKDTVATNMTTVDAMCQWDESMQKKNDFIAHVC